MEQIQQLMARLDEAIAAMPESTPAPGLYRPVSYTLGHGGKRLRPMLALLCCGAVSGRPEQAFNQAMGIEMFHNFTLIHDDVMDRSPRRRGLPTVYRRWGDVQAILSGDALLTLATMSVAQDAGDRLPEILGIFNRTALEVYEGQQLDIEFETRSRVSIASYINMIRLKTSVLLGAACKIGAVAAGASADVADSLYRYGESLGLAFQLRDDWLDVWGDPDTFGKAIGNDIITRKKTWLYIRAMQLRPEAMDKALEIKNNNSKVCAVRRVYESCGLSEQCDRLIDKYCDEALAALASAGVDARYADYLSAIAHKLSKRNK